MESSTEPILDVVRGLSTVRIGFAEMGAEAKNFYLNLFRSPCRHCRGAGTVICRHCHGTKIRRTYPLRSTTRAAGLDHPSLQYECYHCGPYALNDFDYDKEEDDEEAWNMMDNLKAAMANKPRPHKHKAVAGTTPCPMCHGQCVLFRHTPDFASLFNMHGTWMDQIRAKSIKHKDEIPDLDFVEEVVVGKPPDLPPIKKKMPNIRGLDGRSLDEVILPYIDDSDTTESSGEDIDEDNYFPDAD